jgi:sterol-4alpha-carboxylate 3-dehydrogenase (decarboxylating)
MEGPALVTGGAGFFGYHLIKALLQESGCGPIVSINRNPKTNFHEGVEYRAGSIDNEDFIRGVFNDVKPRVIFHVAAPHPESDCPTSRKIGVEGTRVLLKVAAECGSVKTFVYTSSVGVAAGMLHRNVDELAPTWNPDSCCSHYHKAKAIAEREVLAANCKDMRTVSLRLCMIIGERDVGFIAMCADMLERGGTGYQIGPNSSLFCSVSAENAAVAHVLAAKALMDSSRSSQVEGKAFNITDGNPMPFWDLPRIAWRAAGDTSDPNKVIVIPSWVAYTIATALEVLYALFTFGTKSSPFKRSHVDYLVLENTYNIEKAKRVLGYRPVVNTHEVLKQSMEWELKKREQEKRSKKSK